MKLWILNETKCCNTAGKVHIPRYAVTLLGLAHQPRAIVEWRSKCKLSVLPEDLASCHGQRMLRNESKGRLTEGSDPSTVLMCLPHTAKHILNEEWSLLDLVPRKQSKHWRKLFSVNWNKINNKKHKEIGDPEYLTFVFQQFSALCFLECTKKQPAIIYIMKVKFSLFTPRRHIRETEV